MRFPAFAICLAALAAAILLAYADSPDRSVATSPPSAQRFSIDMRPAFLPANTSSSLGTVEIRVQANENDILDADEDFVDTVEFDVTATGIPASNAMIGYTYRLSYPSVSVSVISQQPMMINPPIITSDPLPDTDGAFNTSTLDLGGSGVSGSGVLDRLRIQTSPGAAAGVFPLTLGNAAHIDTSGNSWAPDAIDAAMICVNTSCGPLIDFEMVSLSLSSVNPVPNDVNSTVTATETVTNPSGYTTTPSTSTTFTVPSDCIVNGSGGTVVVNAGIGTVPGLSTVSYPVTATLRCTAQGPHQMPVTACVDGWFMSTDPVRSNDCKPGTLSFNVALPDTDGDGYSDEAEAGTPLCGDGRNEDGVVAGGASDDGVVDDGCPGGPPQAGTYSEAQFNIGTDPLDSCGTDGNPADLVSGSIPDSTNRVTLADLASFLAPRRLDTSPGDARFNPRWDLTPGRGVFGNWINIADLTSMIVVRPTVSPWNGGRAFGGPACSP